MSRVPRTRPGGELRRTTTVKIDDDLWPAFLTFMSTHDIENPSSAVKALVIQALAATPRDGVIIASCQRAFKTVLTQVMHATGEHYKQMQAYTEQATKELLSRSLQCPHCHGNLT